MLRAWNPLSADCFAIACRAMDVRVIQALLGHAKLTTTGGYTHVATGMIAAVDSPLDDLSKPRRKKRKTRSS